MKMGGSRSKVLGFRVKTAGSGEKGFRFGVKVWGLGLNT